MTIEELKERILPGYSYTLGVHPNFKTESSVVVWTGYQGVLNYIDELKDACSPELIAETIAVNIDNWMKPIPILQTQVKDNEA